MRKWRSLKLHEVLLGIGILFNVAALALIWGTGIEQPYIDDAFSYTADVIEADNTYDAARSSFLGARYSKATMQLSLDTTQAQPRMVSKLSGVGSMPTITRERSVNTKTGEYTGAAGVYVFAPRGLAKDSSFSYQHPAYDTPALMRYVGEETVGGLKVYRYKAEFGKDGAEAPAGSVAVAQDQRAAYKPDLQVWIEPVSGWLVNYQDDTTLSIYNRASGAVVRPVYHAVTRMSDDSVAQHIAYAKGQRLALVFASQIAPSIAILIVLTVLFAFALMQLRSPRTIPLSVALTIITIVPAIALLGWLLSAPPLITLFFSDIGLNPMAAICFMLVGLAIVLRRYRKKLGMAFIGGIVGIIATLQLLGSLEVLPFQVDLLLFRDAILAASDTHLSRMSPYAAFAFLVLGIVLVKAGNTSRYSPFHFARFMAGIVVMLGLFGVLAQFLQLRDVFTITFIQSLSLIASLLFMVCGFTLLQLFRSLNDKADDVRSTIQSLMWPSLATVPLIVIIIFAQVQQNAVRQGLQAKFREQYASIESAVTERVNIYVNTLTGVQALFSSGEVSQEVWHRFVSSYKGSEKYPGMTPLGYARLVPSGETRTRAFGNGEMTTIFPEATSAGIERFPIVYVDPLTSETTKRLGYDLTSDTVQSDVLAQARDSGVAHLSGRLTEPGADGARRSRVFLAVPVYKGGAVPSTLSERHSLLIGYVFGMIDLQPMLGSALKSESSDIDFEIYDGLNTQPENLMYSRRLETGTTPRLTEKSTFFVAEQPWTVVYAAQSGFRLSLQEELSPTIILLGGSFGYVAVLSIIYLLVDVGRRRRAEVSKR